jgi:hypothetical protein
MSQYEVWQQKKRSAAFVTPAESAGNAGMKELEAQTRLGLPFDGPGNFACIGAHPGSAAESILNSTRDAADRFVICSGPRHIADSDREYCYKISSFNRSRCTFFPEEFRAGHLAKLPPRSHITIDVSSFNDDDTPDDHWHYIKPIVEQVVNVSRQRDHTFDFKLRGCSTLIVKALCKLNSEWQVDVFKPAFSYWWNPEVVVTVAGPRPTHLRANRRVFAGRLRAFLDQLGPLMAVSEVSRLLSRSSADRNPAQLDRSFQTLLVRLATDSPRFTPRIRGDARVSSDGLYIYESDDDGFSE